MKPEQIAKESEGSHQAALFSRKQAKEIGLVYYDGRPCYKCQTTQKYTLGGNCVNCNKIRLQLTKDKNNESKRNKHALDKTVKSKRDKIWRDANPDKISVYNIRHREHRIELCKKWRKENPEKAALIAKRGGSNYRGRKKNAEGFISDLDIIRMRFEQKEECYYCNTSILNYFEIEHKLPISRGGNNLQNNIVLSCNPCNAQKNNKTVDEWFNHSNCRATKR